MVDQATNDTKRDEGKVKMFIGSIDGHAISV